MMKHPTQEQWMEYLYDEMALPERQAFETHVELCAECRAKKVDLEGAAQSLDKWRLQLPARHRFAPGWQPAIKWAAAAVLLVSTAFATGRMSRPEVDTLALQAEVSKAVEAKMTTQAQIAAERALKTAQEHLTARMQAEISAKLQEATEKAIAESAAHVRKQIEQLSVTLATLREEDKKALATALQTLEQQRIADYRRMREDLERVALYTDENFRVAQRQLVQLANFPQE